jgi:hypothetical protein
MKGGSDMTKENEMINSVDALSVQETMEDIWRKTCGTWENCNESNVEPFLSKCLDHNIDPQYCMNWIIQHSDQIPNQSAVLDKAREWVNKHTSTGSPISASNPITD